MFIVNDNYNSFLNKLFNSFLPLGVISNYQFTAIGDETYRKGTEVTVLLSTLAYVRVVAEDAAALAKSRTKLPPMITITIHILFFFFASRIKNCGKKLDVI